MRECMHGLLNLHMFFFTLYFPTTNRNNTYVWEMWIHVSSSARTMNIEWCSQAHTLIQNTQYISPYVRDVMWSNSTKHHRLTIIIVIIIIKNNICHQTRFFKIRVLYLHFSFCSHRLTRLASFISFLFKFLQEMVKWE